MITSTILSLSESLRTSPLANAERSLPTFLLVPNFPTVTPSTSVDLDVSFSCDATLT